MGVRRISMMSHELKNPHNCARCMKFLFPAVQVTDIMLGKHGRFHG
jgi:hypothetical protein